MQIYNSVIDMKPRISLIDLPACCYIGYSNIEHMLSLVLYPMVQEWRNNRNNFRGADVGIIFLEEKDFNYWFGFISALWKISITDSYTIIITRYIIFNDMIKTPDDIKLSEGFYFFDYQYFIDSFDFQCYHREKDWNAHAEFKRE